MQPRKIILDCDPGHDDAIAIILAGKNPNIELLGITVESGNQTLEKTGKNALNLCQYLGLDIPVCLGASEPILRKVVVCPEIHGESGLDGFDFEPLVKGYDPRHAVTFIIETLMASEEKDYDGDHRTHDQSCIGDENGTQNQRSHSRSSLNGRIYCKWQCHSSCRIQYSI